MILGSMLAILLRPAYAAKALLALSHLAKV
jgi:hypothetical protein